MKVKSNEAGVCPICNNSMLDYDTIEMANSNAGFYAWHCTECGAKGEEWVKMEFIGHNVEDKNGNMYEIEDKDLEV